MSFIEARYLDGSSVYVKSETVGGLMVHFANLHQRFASDIAVVCPATGRDLTDPPSQMSPPLVQVVVKPEEVKNSTKEDLLLTFHLHAQHEDTATCARAYEILQKEYRWGQSEEPLLDMLDKVAGGDIDIEAKIIRAFIHVGLDLHFVLERACGDGNESRVKMLLSQGVPIECRDNMNYIDDDEYVDGIQGKVQPLCAAAYHGNEGVAKILIAQGARMNCSSVIYKTFGNPLIFASSNGHADMVRMLLNHGAQVDDARGMFWPLGEACASAKVNVAEILLSHRADPNFKSPGTGCTPLLKAIYSRKLHVVQFILAQRADVNLKSDDGYAPLIFVYTPWSSRSTDIVKVLVDYRAHVNCVGPTGDAALSYVAAVGTVDSAKVLLDNGANVNHVNNVTGATALIRALSRIDMVNILLTHKASVNHPDKAGRTALARALYIDDKPLVEILQHHSAITRPNLSEKTFADQSEGESRNCPAASANKRSITDKNEEGSGYCSATSANKRHKTNEDETSGKKNFVCGNDVVQEKMERHEEHPSCNEDEKIEENKSDASGSGSSTGKEMMTFDDN